MTLTCPFEILNIFIHCLPLVIFVLNNKTTLFIMPFYQLIDYQNGRDLSKVK